MYVHRFSNDGKRRRRRTTTTHFRLANNHLKKVKKKKKKGSLFYPILRIYYTRLVRTLTVKRKFPLFSPSSASPIYWTLKKPKRELTGWTFFPFFVLLLSLCCLPKTTMTGTHLCACLPACPLHFAGCRRKKEIELTRQEKGSEQQQQQQQLRNKGELF